MTKVHQLAMAVVLGTCALGAQAIQTGGSAVHVQAVGEVASANDQAQLVLSVEEQDKDKAIAASRVNTTMKLGTDRLRSMDASAQLKTQGYYTYPVYAEAQPKAGQAREIVGWRVGQRLAVTTQNIAGLPKLVAAVQGTLALSDIRFGLSPAAQKQHDAAVLASAYKNLSERASALAAAMGRNPADLVLEVVDLTPAGHAAPQLMMARASMKADSESGVAEPSFEPGESVMSQEITGKFRLK